MPTIYREFQIEIESYTWTGENKSTAVLAAAYAAATYNEGAGTLPSGSNKNTRQNYVTITMDNETYGDGSFYVPPETNSAYIMNFEYDSEDNQSYFSSGETAYNTFSFDRTSVNAGGTAQWNGTTTGFNISNNSVTGNGVFVFDLQVGSTANWLYWLNNSAYNKLENDGSELASVDFDKMHISQVNAPNDTDFSFGTVGAQIGMSSALVNTSWCHCAIQLADNVFLPVSIHITPYWSQTFSNPSPYGPNCMDQDTKVLCLTKDLKEEQIAVKDLRPGDVVKTYKQGYRRINQIAHQPGFNDTTSERKASARYVLRKTEENGLTEDLYLAAKHLILVDKLTPEQEKNEIETFAQTFNVMDKALVQARHHPDFEMVEEPGYYIYYQMTLENDGDVNQRHGIWTNGYLTETTCSHDFETHLGGMTRIK